MQPYEGDEPAEYRGAPAGRRYGRAYRGGEQPPRWSGYGSPPPRGGRLPPSPSPQTREELAGGRAGAVPSAGQPGAGPPTRDPPGGPAYPPTYPEATATGDVAAGGQPGGQTSPARPAGRPRADAGSLAPVGVEGLLEREVVTAERDTPIATVAARMAERNVGSVVVVDDDAPVGVVTDRRIALALETDPDVSTRRADELVTGELVSGTTEMSVVDVLDRFAESGVRRLPIVDEDGALAGIVTIDDVLLLVGEMLGDVADVVRTQSPRR